MQDSPYFFHQNFSKTVRLGFCVLAILLLGIIVFLSLGKAHQVAISLDNADKFAHGFAYFALGLMAVPALGKMRAIYIWMGLSLCGVGLEITQGLMKIGRQADIFDAFANALGALFSLVTWFVVSFWVASRKANVQRADSPLTRIK